MPLGRSVINPVNGERIPMYVADYVLMEYGTGAIMAVPGHDARDFDFATEFGLEIRRVVDGGDGELPYTGDGPLVNSAAQFDGVHNREALEQIVDWLDREGKGHRSDQLPPARLAAVPPALLGLPDPDRLLRRARHASPCRRPTCRCVLPDVEDYAPQGKSPLAAAEDWVNTTCPRLRRPRPPRDRHDGHLRRLVLVLPALHATPTTTTRPGTGRSWTPGCRSTSTSAASSTRSCT